jgi:hypothetical protein
LLGISSDSPEFKYLAKKIWTFYKNYDLIYLLLKTKYLAHTQTTKWAIMKKFVQWLNFLLSASLALFVGGWFFLLNGVIDVSQGLQDEPVDKLQALWGFTQIFLSWVAVIVLFLACAWLLSSMFSSIVPSLRYERDNRRAIKRAFAPWR